MVEVRRAQARDCEAIARLSGEAVREAGGQAAPFEPDLVRKHGFGAQPLIEIFVAEERRNGPLIGHAIITKSFDTRHAAVTVTLCELYVRPAARGGGVARTLIAAVAQRVAELGARELIITTGVEDVTARKFFSAVGAKEAQAVVFRVNADGVQWLAAEAR
ncbi:MAG: GNAT family N-acetyltransferase [Hyphomonadaceae bacterium]|nr:GNAT family N-acetyltransferase [Hyphomonadaceae bacterium]